MRMARVGVIAFWGSMVGILEVREELSMGVIVRGIWGESERGRDGDGRTYDPTAIEGSLAQVVTCWHWPWLLHWMYSRGGGGGG